MRSHSKNPGLTAGVLLAAVLATSFAVVSLATAQTAREQGYLGVTTQTLTDELREGLDFSFRGDGALVNEVADDSPADRAGIRQGDIITSVAGESVDGSAALRRIVRAHREGETVTVRVVRDGETRTYSIRLAGVSGSDDSGDTFEWRVAPRAPRTPEPPDAPEAPKAPRAPRIRSFSFGDGAMPDLRGLEELGMLGQPRLGVRIESLTPDLAEYFRTPSGKGALVMSVVKGSAAEKAGIRGGDVITKVGSRAVSDADDLVAALRDVDAGDASITLVRRGATQTVTARLEERETPRVFRMRSPGHLQWNEDDSAKLKREMEGLRRERDNLGDRDEMRREMDRLREELDRLREEMNRLNERR